MNSAENLLSQMRALARQSLPQRAFLRRDRGDFLWVSNAPVFDPAIETLSGFITRREERLLYLLPDAGWIERWEEQSARDHLSESLMHFRGESVDPAALYLFAKGLKLLEDNTPSMEISRFEQQTRQRAALALRHGCSGGGLYACALIQARLKNTHI